MEGSSLPENTFLHLEGGIVHRQMGSRIRTGNIQKSKGAGGKGLVMGKILVAHGGFKILAEKLRSQSLFDRFGYQGGKGRIVKNRWYLRQPLDLPLTAQGGTKPGCNFLNALFIKALGFRTGSPDGTLQIGLGRYDIQEEPAWT